MDKRERTAEEYIIVGVEFAEQYFYAVEQIRHQRRMAVTAMKELDDYVYAEYFSNVSACEDVAVSDVKVKSDPTPKMAELLEQQKKYILDEFDEQSREYKQKRENMLLIIGRAMLDIYEQRIFDYKYGDWFGTRPSNVWIAVQMGVDESTIRRWEKSAFEKIGRIL